MAEQVDSVQHKVRGGVQSAVCMKANETGQSKIMKFTIYSELLKKSGFIWRELKCPQWRSVSRATT